MKGTILQPTYLPWLGYFEMITSSDIFVIFDHVQFERKSWQQRNQIKTANGIVLLTVPVKNEGRYTRICDAKILYDQGNQLEKHWRTIKLAYKKAPYFSEYESLFEEIYLQKPEYLRNLNVALIKQICVILGMKSKFVFSSELDLDDKKMERTAKVVNLCKKAGLTHLYDAGGAEKLLDKEQFQNANISLSFQKYEHPKYKQLWGDFVPYVSIIDLLFNEGEKAREIIMKGNKKNEHESFKTL